MNEYEDGTPLFHQAEDLLGVGGGIGDFEAVHEQSLVVQDFRIKLHLLGIASFLSGLQHG